MQAMKNSYRSRNPKPDPFHWASRPFVFAMVGVLSSCLSSVLTCRLRAGCTKQSLLHNVPRVYHSFAFLSPALCGHSLLVTHDWSAVPAEVNDLGRFGIVGRLQAQVQKDVLSTKL